MDVQDLLHDSGLGRDTHSIISQGRLDEILNSRPEDRRALIEEAAGVLKHKKRKERALRKLTAMDANLERARDMLARGRTAASAAAAPGRPRPGSTTRWPRSSRDRDLAWPSTTSARLHAQWDGILKAEREHDADIELARYRLSREGARTREVPVAARGEGAVRRRPLRAAAAPADRARAPRIAGLLLLEEKGKNLIEKLSELRAKVHGAETRRARRSDELARLTEERAALDAHLKAHYQRLGETAPRVGDGAQGAARRREQPERRERVDPPQPQGARRRARRHRRGRADAVRVRTRAGTAHREGDDAHDAAREPLHDARRTPCEAGRQRDGAHARRGSRSRWRSRDVDRGSASWSPPSGAGRRRATRSARCARRREVSRRSTARSRPPRRRSPGCCPPSTRCTGCSGPVTDLIDVDPADEKARRARARARTSSACSWRTCRPAPTVLCAARRARRGRHLRPRRRTPRGPPTARPGRRQARCADLIGCDDASVPPSRHCSGTSTSLPTLDEALDASRRFPDSRFITPDGHMVWPSGKVTLGPALDPNAIACSPAQATDQRAPGRRERASRPAWARPRRCSRRRRRRCARPSRTPWSSAQRIAAQYGRARLAPRGDRAPGDRAHRSRRRGALAIRARPTMISGEDFEGPPRRDAAHGAHRSSSRRRLERARGRGHPQAREPRRPLPRGGGDPERLGACQVEIATVSEREVHLKRQVATVAADLAELEETLRLVASRRRPLSSCCASGSSPSTTCTPPCWSAPSTGRSSCATAPASSRRTPSRCATTIRTAQDGGPRGAGRARRASSRPSPTSGWRRVSSRCR